MIMHFKRNRRLWAAVAIAVGLYLVGVVTIEGYGSIFTLRSTLILASMLGIAAVGQTLVIILGGIDLSIPFIVGFANVVVAQLHGQGMSFAVIMAIVVLVALLIGALNGFLASSLSIHPLIITLGVGTALQGCVLLWTHGLPSGAAPAFITNFVSIGGTFGPLPFPGVVPAFFVLAGLVWLFLARTGFGRQLYALGSNPQAAPYVLIKPVFTWTVAFALSAVFAAIAGVLTLGFTGTAYADVGEPYLFETIAAVVVGGTALVGGRGSYIGTVIGAIVLKELNMLLIGYGVPPASVEAVLGLMIIVLVSIYGRESHLRSQI